MDNLPDKNEKATSGSVAIEGATIKSVRETKKLTQLYVANVVGVTTDTISRWENNRYPTIKRDNAEKLAQALEVPLEDILRQEAAELPAEAVEQEPVKPRPRTGRTVFLVAATVILLIALTILFVMGTRPAAVVAVRWAPAFAAPGEVIPVQIMVTRKDAASQGLIIKEKLPSGWRFLNGSPPAASGSTPSGEVKWLIPGGSGAVKISYLVQLPQDVPVNTKTDLRGAVLVHSGNLSRAETITGRTKIAIGPYHWADTNGDGRIDDGEIMPAYYMTEDMKGLGLDWKGIEAIWSGSGYRWNAAARAFEVLK